MKDLFLCVNLGSPKHWDVVAVKAYLSEFLMDKHVIDVPWLLRFLLVKGLVVPFRSPKTSEAYRGIWMEEGSPLVVYTERMMRALKEKVSFSVELAMTYGDNDIATCIQRMVGEQGSSARRLHLLPLFPHYAMSTTQAVVDHVHASVQKYAPQWELHVVKLFFEHQAYILALKARLATFDVASYDHIVFSYHGLPVRHLLKTDPTQSHCMKVPNCCEVTSVARTTCYRAQVVQTMQLLSRELELKPTQWTLAFQSRFGKDTWLIPDTEAVLKKLPQQGARRILVVSTAFVADCLETLEELGMRGRKCFKDAGGDVLDIVPCLNDHPVWIETLATLMEEHIRSVEGKCDDA